MPDDLFTPVAATLPAASSLLWLTALAFAPLLLYLLIHRLQPRLVTALPAPVQGGIPLVLGLTGMAVAVIGCWLMSSNGVWRDADTFYLRASRAFFAEIPLKEMRPQDAAPLDFAHLESDGRIRTPGYAAGWYRDRSGRRVFVLWSGAPLTRIPTERPYDIAVALDSAESLQ